MDASLAASLILLLQFAYEGHGATTASVPVQNMNTTTTPVSTGIKLTSSTDVIQSALTRDFSITCSFPKPEDVGLTTITSMVISKGGNRAMHHEIASVIFVRPLEVMTSNIAATATGQLDQQGQSYLRLDWTDPPENITGVYECEVSGLNVWAHPVSGTASISISSQSPDMKSLVNQFRIFTMHQEVTIAKLKDQLRKQHATEREMLNQIRTQKDQLMKQNISIANMKDQIREQNATDQELVSQILTQESQLHDQNVTDRELMDQIKSHNMTINDMQQHLQTQNVMANVTSLKDRVRVFELFDMSAVRGGKQYLVSRFANVNISTAEASCNMAGGHLADIKTTAERDVVKAFIQTLVKNSRISSTFFSPTQETHPGLWLYRHSGKRMAFIDFWYPGNPDDNVNNSCAALGHLQWKAFNVPCSGGPGYNFICERETIL